MTIQDLINWFDNNQIYIIGYFGIIMILSLLITYSVTPKNISNLKYLMSTFVYGVCIPGILAVFLLLYNVLFLKTNILKISLVSYFLPIVSMFITLLILNKKVRMSKLPGFTKLTSLFIIISISFLLIFILQRTYFGVLFLGSITHIIIGFIILMIIVKIAWNRLVK